MARGDQLGRQWKIIRTLIASQTGKSVQDIASDLNCHTRTVYRDLEALQTAGFPVYTERFNNKSYWFLLESARHQIPIPLNLTELMALYFSRDMLKVLENTIFYDSLESLFQKIKTTLPPETIQYLDKIGDSLQVGFKSYKKYGKFKETIAQANEAVMHKHHIRIRYHTMSRQKDSERIVAPYRLWFFDGTFYLLGYCLLRNDIRLFAVDRIKKLETMDTTFESPDNFDIERLLHSSFGAFIGDVTPVEIRFSPDVAGYVMEKIWHESQAIEQQLDGSIIFRAEVAGTKEIKFWIMSWGSKAQVLSPESLRNEIAAEAGAMLGKYKQE